MPDSDSGGDLDPSWKYAYARIEAEIFDDMEGVELENDDSTVGYFEGGDWIRYDNVYWGDVTAKFVEIRLAGWNPGRQFEVRIDDLDGPLLATIDVPVTGGFTSFSAELFGVDAEKGADVRALLRRRLVGESDAAAAGGSGGAEAGKATQGSPSRTEPLNQTTTTQQQHVGSRKPVWSWFLHAVYYGRRSGGGAIDAPIIVTSVA